MPRLAALREDGFALSAACANPAHAECIPWHFHDGTLRLGFFQIV